MYKLNIHAHTHFSDGCSSPYVMALEAKRLGFSALVITDHFYGMNSDFSLNESKFKLLRKSCSEARGILPVIVGIEIPFMEQEVLVFGGAAIKSILKNGLPTMETLAGLKGTTGCAVILCHPRAEFENTLPVIDGFERFNSGYDFFDRGIGLAKFSDMQSWCNSDAHHVDKLKTSYNKVDTKIETEHELIRYIKRGKQPIFYWKEVTSVRT